MKFRLLIALVGVAACHRAATNEPPDTSLRASAELRDATGKPVGMARFVESTGITGVTVSVEMDGIAPGQHGIHIHAVGRCDAAGAFASAGGHFNPAGAKHGLGAPGGPHAGDMNAAIVDPSGHSVFVVVDPRVTLSAGPNSLFDADGSALVVHAAPDDQRTDPSGNSGARVACGVITKS
jgi:Cu-Zn family superoxide dismutase